MRFIIFIFFLFCSNLTIAQDISFIVYHTQGKITTNTGKSSLKSGDKLYPSNYITLAQGANLILVCKNFEIIRLDIKGRYDVKTLLRKCEKTAPSFTSSYFSYVWDELTHPHGSPEEEPTHYMRNVGSVSRGCSMVETKLPVDTLLYATGRLPIYYITNIKAPHITVYSEAVDGELLLNYPLREMPVLIDTLKTLLKKPGIYYWQITNADGSGCERNVLKILNPKSYKSTIDKILKKLIPAKPAETAFMKGFILEENHFIAEAFNYYKLAGELNPNNKYYKLALSRFYTGSR